MEKLKAARDYYLSLSQQRKIELYIIVIVAIFMIVAMFFVFQRTKAAFSDESGIPILQKQNQELINQNLNLIRTVEGLSITMQERNKRDSVELAEIVVSTQALPGINNRLNQIDKDYYEKITSVRNLSDNDIAAYIRAEAARLRNQRE